MLKFKKVFALTIAAALCAALLTSCAAFNGGDEEEGTTTEPITTTESITTEAEDGAENGDGADIADGEYDVVIDGRIGVNAPGRVLGEDDGLGWPTHIPLVAVAEAMGAEVTHSEESGVVTLTGLNGDISFDVGSRNFNVGGNTVTLEESAQMVDDVLYVPILFFRDVYGAASAIFSGGTVEISTHAGDMS